MAHPDEFPANGGVPQRIAAARGRGGFFRVARDDGGCWWLRDPEGAPFFARCAHGVRPAPPHRDGVVPRDSVAQLRAWAFNAIGVASATGSDDGLPFLGSVDFCLAGPVIAAPGLRLPDVFDPEWPRRAEIRALEVCAPQAGNRALIGWVTDHDLSWAQGVRSDRPTLLQLCLSLEPGFAAYHAAWEFVLALHGGRLKALGHSWGVAVGNKEVLRELTRNESAIATRGYLRDNARWTREFARRYFTSTATAVRAVDADHLVLGCRLRQADGAGVLGACAYPAVDVAMPDWRGVPMAGLHQPVLAGEVGWVDEEFLQPSFGGRAQALTSVERMLRRARAALERVARHPATVGYAWGEWQDGPGEQPPFARGLLHLNGAEAREHTELLTWFNLRAENLHRNQPIRPAA